jgi:FkbM family methyltransferase
MKTTEIDVRGVKMKLSTHTKSLELCARMNYETENLDFIVNLTQGAIFYDLGACEGRFSIYAGLKGHKVVAFEPEKMNYETFVKNISLNNLDDFITAENAGVDEADGTAIMNIGQPWAGGHQKVVEHNNVRSDVEFEFKSKQEINIISFDSYIEKSKVASPVFLKIDIDGSEISLLKGAQNAFKDARKVIFELSKTDRNYKKIIEIFESNVLIIEEEFQVPNEPDLFNIVFSK